MPHLLVQAIRAHTVYERDKDYVVVPMDNPQTGQKEPSVVIVDAFTGRLQVGRQWSDGLHQAVEAKENVPIKQETQTVATVTIQNFFKMYGKLAGMTGTAETEENEFHQIYDLDVMVIPTNRPVVREDREDLIFRTKREKFNAMIEEIQRLNKMEMPVLVGTTNVEVSETFSRMLKRRGIKHNVLNAKHHAREAEIVAEAGQPGAVTIATNMAGRGTDIKLGGNVEFKVMEAIAHNISDEVWVVAPAFEQSGVGHCISYVHPTMISRLGVNRYAAEGTPADCVLAGLHDVMKDSRPDLVLSGVNRGNNAAENVLYSGTIGAALEAALQGVPSVALSQYFGPDNLQLDDPFEAALEHGAATVRALLDHGHWDNEDYRTFYNVNFPPVSSANVKGMKVAAQGFRRDTSFSTEPHMSPSGSMFLWVKGGPQHVPTDPGTDAAVNLEGYISVTPLQADLTAHDTLETLRDRLE